MQYFKIGIIGCGNMGRAIAGGLVKKGIVSSADVFLFDTDIVKCYELAQNTGCLQGDVHQVIRGADHIVIAVKPQDFPVLAAQISSIIESQTVISIMAGVKISAIERHLGRKLPVARAMPNMGALAGASVTCVACNDLVGDRSGVNEIFRGIGTVVEMEEDMLDAATAVSGSGPAYFFYLADALLAAARKIGFEEALAARLVSETFYGAAALLGQGRDAPGELVKKVSSRGGTTEAAMEVFGERKVREAVIEAVKKAEERSVELSERSM